MTAPDPVGATEIAARCGVGRPTVERWQERHPDFPPRRWTVGGRPAWDWNLDIAPWLTKTNRPTGAAMSSTMWTLDTEALTGTVQAVLADIRVGYLSPSQGGRLGTTVSQGSDNGQPPANLAALAAELRNRGYRTHLAPGS